MSRPPLIGITPASNQEPPFRDWMYNTSDYFRSVQRAGAIPVLLPFLTSRLQADHLLDRLDGLLLSGGGDLDPVHFREQPHPKLGEISPERDTTELLLAGAALERDLPLLGICRGHQVLAVVEGGTLWQDIPSQVPAAIQHRQNAPRWHPAHAVQTVPGTRLAALCGSEFRVNSFHHQAVCNLPAGWVGSAAAPDGINEGMEHPGHRFALAVQWHPENFTGRSYNFDPLFAAFVQVCQN